MISIVGAGAMGEALVNGWVAAGIAPDDIRVVDRDQARLAHFASLGVTSASLDEAATCEVLFVAVKPAQVPEVLTEAAATIRPTTLVVSIAAGVTLARLAEHLPNAQPVVRVMPNTPAQVGKGVSGIAPGTHAGDDHIAQVVELMTAVGSTLVVAEDRLDAVTALSGSGPAYLFAVAEAMIEAGVHQGLTRDQATRLVVGTFGGAAAMLESSGESATVLRERVTSPAGTTAAALRVLDERGVRAAFLAAVEACARRSAEL